MITIFSKTYVLPIHRQISKAYLKPTETNRADIYIDNSGVFDLEIKNTDNYNYQSTIYNINRESTKLVITTNTLNLNITNKSINSKPLYKKVIVLEEEIDAVVSLIIETIGDEYLIVDNEIYFNTTLKYLESIEIFKIIEPAFKLGNSMLHDDRVSFRRLKDRIKISIKTNESENYFVEISNKNLFAPIIYNNWIEIPECVFKNKDDKYIHVYNHSFNFITKSEVIKNEAEVLKSIKDPVVDLNSLEITPLNSTFNKIEYTSYRSNLLYNVQLNNDLYLYLNLNYENSTDPFIFTTTELFDENYIYLFSIKKLNNTIEPLVVKSPFTENKIYNTKGEDYTFIFSDSISKYKAPNDIRFGTNRVILNIEDLIKQKAIYLVKEGLPIYQRNIVREIHKELVDMETYVFPNTLPFVSDINFSYSYEYDSTDFPDPIKYYSNS